MNTRLQAAGIGLPSSSLNRRAVLGGLALATVTPALALAARPQDADVTDLLAKFDSLSPEQRTIVSDFMDAMLADQDGVAPTPILRLFREWEAMDAQMDKLSGEAADAMLADLLALELRLRSTPSTGVADFAAKVVAFTFWGGACLYEGDAPEIWEEARALLGSAGA
ncbi:hypothetical protein [Cereibacter azotoformans]|uniref:hypothetical protein n=1 Tax=Cereibacter azotoformans TaxID=43057 RepID=UPI000C6DE1A5|nr:hypothetical protein [Cereibacter azotoformans]